MTGIHIADYGIHFSAEEKRKFIQHIIKQNNSRILIETGTYLGDTINFLKDSLGEIISIELSDFYYKKAVERFKDQKKITILHGDSSKILPEILKKINEPCLFWLDGHYSSGNTAKGDKNTPIFSELSSIINHQIKNHIILIDDARLFIGRDDYPWLPNLRKYVDVTSKNLYTISVEKDIIVLTPKK